MNSQVLELAVGELDKPPELIIVYDRAKVCRAVVFVAGDTTESHK
jgi:hypothetical protein